MAFRFVALFLDCYRRDSLDCELWRMPYVWTAAVDPLWGLHVEHLTLDLVVTTLETNMTWVS